MRLRLAVVCVIGGLVAVAPLPASAAVTSEVVGGELRVSGTGLMDVVQIWCDGGAVMVNGEDPGSGTTPCTDLTGIVISGGDGGDVIYLHQVYPADFPGLRSIRADGEGGYDSLRGSPGDDELVGGDDDDRIYASAGSDELSAGTGYDRLFVETVGDVTLTDASVVTSLGTSGLSGFEESFIRSEAGGDVRIDARTFRGATSMKTGRGDDVLLGAIGRDFMTGSGGADRLVGRDGWDQIDGGRGNDVLLGGSGNDRLIGGPGRDRCRGGSGGNILVDC